MYRNQKCKFDKYSDICNMCSRIAPSEYAKILLERKLIECFNKHSQGVSEDINGELYTIYDKTAIIEDIMNSKEVDMLVNGDGFENISESVKKYKQDIDEYLERVGTKLGIPGEFAKDIEW